MQAELARLKAENKALLAESKTLQQVLSLLALLVPKSVGFASTKVARLKAENKGAARAETKFTGFTGTSWLCWYKGAARAENKGAGAHLRGDARLLEEVCLDLCAHYQHAPRVEN